MRLIRTNHRVKSVYFRGIMTICSILFFFLFIIALCFIDSSSADTNYNTNLRTRRLIVDFVLFKKSSHLDTLVCFLAYHSSTSILSRSSASL